MSAAPPSKTQSQPSDASPSNLLSADDALPPHCRESSSPETAARGTAPAYCSAKMNSHSQTTPSAPEKASPDRAPSPATSTTHTPAASPCSATPAASHFHALPSAAHTSHAP